MSFPLAITLAFLLVAGGLHGAARFLSLLPGASSFTEVLAIITMIAMSLAAVACGVALSWQEGQP